MYRDLHGTNKSPNTLHHDQRATVSHLLCKVTWNAAILNNFHLHGVHRTTTPESQLQKITGIGVFPSQRVRPAGQKKAVLMGRRFHILTSKDKSRSAWSY